MYKDPSKFRERFKAYKEGKSVREIYGLPGYVGGKTSNPIEDTADFLRQYEGFMDKTYLDGKGIPTIGYGFTDAKFINKGSISKAEADTELNRLIKVRQSELRNKLGLKIWDSLSNDSKKALTSYHFNYPAGFKENTKFMLYWRAGRYADAIKEVDAGWNDSANPGLRTRRIAEQSLLRNDPVLFSKPTNLKPANNLIQHPDALKVITTIPQEKVIDYTDRRNTVGAEIDRSIWAHNVMNDIQGMSYDVPIWEPNLLPALKPIKLDIAPLKTYNAGKLPGYEGGYIRLNNNPVKFDEETGELVDLVTGEKGTMLLPEITVTRAKPENYRSSFDPNIIRNFTDFAPVVGDIGLGLDAYNAFKNQDYLLAGLLGGMLFLPNAIEKPLNKVFEYTLNPLAKNISRFLDNKEGWKRVFNDIRTDPNRVVTDYINGYYPLTYSQRRKFLESRNQFYSDLMDVADNYELQLREKRLLRHGDKKTVYFGKNYLFDDKPVRPNIISARTIKPTWNGSRYYYSPSTHSISIPTRSDKNSNFTDYYTKPKIFLFNHEYTHALQDDRNINFAPYLSLSKWDSKEKRRIPTMNAVKYFWNEYNPFTNIEDFFNVATKKKDDLFFNKYKHELDPDETVANTRAFVLTPEYTEHDFIKTYGDNRELLLSNDRKMAELIGYKDGKIAIKPANRGKFNATKKRTGKTTEELTHSKNPITRKRAIFALNAKKWHHK